MLYGTNYELIILLIRYHAQLSQFLLIGIFRGKNTKTVCFLPRDLPAVLRQNMHQHCKISSIKPKWSGWLANDLRVLSKSEVQILAGTGQHFSNSSAFFDIQVAKKDIKKWFEKQIQTLYGKFKNSKKIVNRFDLVYPGGRGRLFESKTWNI